MSEILFEVRDLKQYFTSGKKIVRAVDGISFTLRKGEVLSLVGGSGCGKTTCAKALLGIYTPTSGEISWKGKRISSLNRQELTDFRKQNQMIFQNPYTSLDPRMTVAELIGEGLRRHFHLPAAGRRERVAELLRTVGLLEEYASRFPHELSGGQRQRVGIARALALEPECLVCDEPVTALDISTQVQILQLLMDLRKEKNLTILMISHDLRLVRLISTRIAVMHSGKITIVTQ